MYNPLSFGHWRPVVQRQAPGVTDVALTFDDGPTPETTPQVLELLGRKAVKATFFLTGVRIAAYPELAARVVAEGHAVYGHGWEHDNYEWTDPQQAVDAMRRVEELLARLRPTPSPYLLRLPFNAGYNRPRMHRAMTKFHSDVRFTWWSHNTRDFLLADGCENQAALEARCLEIASRLSRVRDLAGSIVLMHESPIGVRGILAPCIVGTLLPPILDVLDARGLRGGLIQVPPRPRLRDRFLFLNFGGDQRIHLSSPE